MKALKSIDFNRGPFIELFTSVSKHLEINLGLVITVTIIRALI